MDPWIHGSAAGAAARAAALSMHHIMVIDHFRSQTREAHYPLYGLRLQCYRGQVKGENGEVSPARLPELYPRASAQLRKARSEIVMACWFKTSAGAWSLAPPSHPALRLGRERQVLAHPPLQRPMPCWRGSAHPISAGAALPSLPTL